MGIRKRTGAKGTTFQVDYIHPITKKRDYETFALRREATAFVKAGYVMPAGVAASTMKHTVRKKDVEIAGSIPTLDTALNRWLHVCEHFGRNGREPVEPGTVRKYKEEAQNIRVLVDTEQPGQPLFKDMALTAINGPVMVRIRDELLKTHSRFMATRNLKSLKAALAQAETDGTITGVPGRSVRIVTSSRNKKRVTIPQPQQILHLLRTSEALVNHRDGRIAAAWPRYSVLIAILVFSGMRPSEARGLPRKNIDIENAAIEITQRANETGIIGPPKTAAGYRVIHLPRPVAALLGVWLDTQPNDPEHLVFGNGHGKPESLANITNRCWYPLLEHAGFEKNAAGKRPFTLYHLRHFRASIEIAKGFDEKDLARLMGHESITMTLDIYGHLFVQKTDDRIAWARAMDVELAANLPQKFLSP